MKSIVRTLLPLVVGLFLCVAAMGKIRELLDPLNVALNRPLSNFGMASLALIEILLAWWLVSGWHHYRALRSSQSILFLFFLISTFKWLNGETECNCFGKGLKVHPFSMMLIDLCLILMLEISARLTVNIKQNWQSENASHDCQLAQKPILKHTTETGLVSFLPVALALISIVVLLIWMGRSMISIVRAEEVDWIQDPGGSDALIVLALGIEPGQPLFTSWVSPSDRKVLLDREVLCLMVNANCETCRTIVSELANCDLSSRAKELVVVEFNRQISASSETFQSRFDDELAEMEARNPSIRRLQTGKPFAIQTVAPALIKLKNGIVESVETDSEFIKALLVQGINHERSTMEPEQTQQRDVHDSGT
jgi:hypothetical protein